MTRLHIATSLTALALVASGCAHVNQEAFDTEIAELRREMQAGDQGVEQRLGDRIDSVDARTRALEERLAMVEGELKALGEEFDLFVERTENSLRLHTPVHFNFDDDSIRKEDESLLNRFSGILLEHYSTALVTVEGFTDPSGSVEYNLKLGQRRADAVKTYLIESSGLAAGQIKAVSYGEDTSRLVRPGTGGSDEVGLENRRVVLVIDHQDLGAEGARAITEGSSA